MTDTQLGALLRDAPDLDPAAADRILQGALADGSRRRRRHRLTWAAGAVATASVAAAAVVAVGLTDPGVSPAPAPEADSATSAPTTPAAPAPTTYDPGSRTEVPGGPVIPTDRAIAGDAALLDAARDLLTDAGDLTGLDVSHTSTSPGHHLADHTLDGRAISLSLDGAAAAVLVQRWDGYDAVGVADPSATTAAGLGQRVATTPREACAGSYKSFPPIDCTESPQGWYSVGRPSQGASSPDTYQELTVELYTPDGYVISVDSFNTPGEKSGPAVAEQPVLSLAESLALAGSDRWFTSGG